MPDIVIHYEGAGDVEFFNVPPTVKYTINTLLTEMGKDNDSKIIKVEERER